jgi:hypothetical protein
MIDTNDEILTEIIITPINNAEPRNNISKFKYYCVEILMYPVPAWINICIFISVIIILFTLKGFKVY